MKPTPTPTARSMPERQAKDAAARKPSKDDLHEQREGNQQKEAVVQATPRPPLQSQIDQERSDWEGMGQGRYQPDADDAKPTSRH